MKKYFFTGLAILLPVAVTIGIVVFIVNLLTAPFLGLVTPYLSEFGHNYPGFSFLSSPQVIKYGSQILILITLFLFILGLGVLARWFIFGYFLRMSDAFLHRIPFINKVYKTTQEIIKSLFSSDKGSFKDVVLVHFPAEGIYSLGLVSQDSPKTCNEAINSDLVSVFIPTTPNPTTGFILLVPRKELIFLEMKTEEAIKYIVSCGVILPKKHTNPLIAGES